MSVYISTYRFRPITNQSLPGQPNIPDQSPPISTTVYPLPTSSVPQVPQSPTTSIPSTQAPSVPHPTTAPQQTSSTDRSKECPPCPSTSQPKVSGKAPTSPTGSPPTPTPTQNRTSSVPGDSNTPNGTHVAHQVIQHFQSDPTLPDTPGI